MSWALCRLLDSSTVIAARMLRFDSRHGRGSWGLGFDPEKPKPAADTRRSVSDGSGDRQLHFRTGSTFAPQCQPRSDSFGPLPDPGQPPMTGARAFLQNCRVDTLSIITDPQTKQIRVVVECNFNPACASMPESVSQYLTSDPVDLVLKQRRQGFRLPLHDHLENGRMTAPILGVPEFLTRGSEQVFQALLSRPQAQVLNGIAALGDGIVSLADRPVERTDGIFGAPGEQVARRLEGEHQPLKTLQQRIV